MTIWAVLRRTRGRLIWDVTVDREFDDLDAAKDWCDYSNDMDAEHIYWIESNGEESA